MVWVILPCHSHGTNALTERNSVLLEVVLPARFRTLLAPPFWFNEFRSLHRNRKSAGWSFPGGVTAKGSPHLFFVFANRLGWFFQQGHPSSPDFIIKKIENIVPITPMHVLWCNFEKPFLCIPQLSECGAV
jgi:hypothetical protein